MYDRISLPGRHRNVYSLSIIFMNTSNSIMILVGIIGALVIGFFLGKGSGMSKMHQEMMSGDTSMHSMMMDMTASLQGKTGAEFDRAFLAEMIIHHEGAVDMAKMVLEQSDRPELQQLANEIITAQEKEIDQMKNWQKEWFSAE